MKKGNKLLNINDLNEDFGYLDKFSKRSKNLSNYIQRYSQLTQLLSEVFSKSSTIKQS